ncbi:MAG TPA: AsmA-like C-terminal region-containing protein [Acetobacteraceae bacterium]
MRPLGGQAARTAWAVLRRLLAFALGCLVVGGVGFAVLAWWLAERPIEMPWLAARIQAQVPGLRVGGAALAWEGFSGGLGSPIDIRLGDVVLRVPADELAVEAPRVQVVLELGALLRGRVRPRTVAIGDASIVVDPADMWRGFGQSGGDNGLFSGLRRVIVRGARIAPADHQGWEVRRLDGELDRSGGETEVNADLALTVGGAATHATLRATERASGNATLRVSMDALPSAAIAAVWPATKDAAAIFAAPVTAEAEVTADGLRPLTARLDLNAGAGTLRTGSAAVPVLKARMLVAWAPGLVTLENASLELRPRADQAPTRLGAQGTARLAPDGITGTASLTLDRLAFDDLAALWPSAVASDARAWVVENVTAGMAHDGQIALRFAANADGSDIRLTGAGGTLGGSDLTVHWLRPIPPVEHGEATLRIVDLDSLRMDIKTGQQSGRLSVQGGSMVVSGLTKPEQIGAIRVSVAGSVPDALALLAHPRLHLLSAHPIPMKDPRGRVVADIAVRLPLLARVLMDQVTLETHARLTDLHLSDVAAGRALDDGAFDLAATGDGLTLKGSGRLADIPAQITSALDFRMGPPAQVQESVTVSAHTQASALAAVGLDTGGVLAGPVDLAATYARRRNGASDIAVRAGLGEAVLRVAQLGWSKPAGSPATARARLVLDGADRLSRVDGIDIAGKGITVQGGAVLGRDGDVTLDLDRFVLGGTNGTGTIHVLDNGRTIRASLSGPRLDVSGRFARRSGGTRPPPAAVADASGPAWVVDAQFDALALARGRLATDLRLHAEGAADTVRAARLSARTGPGKAVQVSITPDRGGRVLRASAVDGGTLLRDLGVTDSIQGGRLSVSARYLDQRSGHPLSGVAELDDFTVHGAPVLAKVLQAVTLYGLVQAVEGPGMRFNHLAAPFVYADGVLELDNARTFNASLGLTAKGRIDFDRERLDMEGTIVPAYYVNTALGRIPLIGRLFSPEKGGGVFAARYSAQGSLDDPAVRVNPLSALTPGFLRGLFGR